ncbi:PI-PLC domain-containing protein [Streptomyces aculeolatus]
MSGARRVWTAVAAALLSALTVLLLCRYTVADPAYYTGAVREADGYQRIYDEVLPDPAVRRVLRSGALGVPLRSDAVVDNLPLLVPRPALEQAAARQARALVAALTGTGRAVPGDDWRGPVTESATEAGSEHLRALRADADPSAARGLTHLIARLREYVTPSSPSPAPTSALRTAVAAFVHDTWPPGTARRIMTALDEVLPGAPPETHGPSTGAGADGTGAEVRPPLMGPPEWWSVAGRGSETRGKRGAELRPPLVVGGEAVGRPGLWSAGPGDGAAGARAGRGLEPRGPSAGEGPGAEPRPPLVARGEGVGRPGRWSAGPGGDAADAGVPALRGPEAGEGPGLESRGQTAGGRSEAESRPPSTEEAADRPGAPSAASGGAVAERRVPLVVEDGAGAGADPASAASSKLPGWVPERGAVVRTVLAAAASWWAVAGVAAAAAVAGVLALRAAARSGRPRARTAAATCAGAAVLTAAAGTAVWAMLPASAGLVPDGLPPSVAVLLTDVVTGLYREAALSWAAALLGLTLTATALALTASTATRRTLHRTHTALTRPPTPPPPTHHHPEPPAPARTEPPPEPAPPRRHRSRAPAPPRPSRPPKATRWAHRAGICAAAAAALAQVWVLVGVPSEAALACNGDVALCGRPYDRVVQVGAHNAMATVPDGFLGAHQDVSLTGQLDRGARALLLDTHYWETAERLVPPAGTGGLDAAARATLVRAVDSVVRPRPGTWLCHGPCRMGATPLAAQLRELRGWLEEHPRDVVTLILQDAITPRDTERAFRAAGLGPYLYRPDPDPAAPWPTLGEMAGSGRRLVVFAEEADGPAPWYRNFYDYAVETPYRARSAGDLSCAPHRGGTDPRKQLFLLNHFVTHGMGAPRAEAAAVNDADVIVRRARTCALLRGRLPTIVAVNHMTLGDAVGAVRRLNAGTS